MAAPGHDDLIMVALSGGVDSAVAAWLLMQQGYRVEALHMTNWEDTAGYCTAAEDLQAARRVAERLGITLHHANFADEYRERVFRSFLDDYAAGRTPNPDVLCNREIKFGECLRHAQRLGADFLATGHYARVRVDNGHTQLLCAADPQKDQTYFLHAVPESSLARAVFPLGDLTKDQVRTLARDIGLPNWDRADSTGICFIGERPFKAFLAEHLEATSGPIEDEHGRVIGRHDGLAFFTLGQRGGLGLGGMANADEAPWYVAAKRVADNTLVVVQGADHPWLLSASLRVKQLHWINQVPEGLAHAAPMAALARIRHRQPLQPVTLSWTGDTDLELVFESPQRGVAPGQYAVLYSGQVCLGGGVIRDSTVMASLPEKRAATP
ncbi:MAG: tRNA 2-thiouridine(34) synthase MnmA [Gammaproteobacteria bacterium]|nr:tRNA 2-thiouridine(34) synthase MnmA [Gammaproteobacteria bacterium]